ncbi:DUF2024 family protein [Ichthyenterobacterium magnum]|uniref:Uncharacterized protein DUF2024 n=1 Tax=Ichthyenterobacterium magnum TaxID=1230530 RepID=A0A420DUK9_9FLAO|nr:DUF2024 family protein [Ichthyenterobacterium magnum]RKE97956.1 uncharacterized protein DUF2024 [Ichthyenterobacterium magnum]
MNVSVWDTYVKRDDSITMHFDILVQSSVTDESIVFNFGKAYLKTKGITNPIITTKECRFCHIETAPKSVIDDIAKKGYSIIEMENCY